MGKIVYYVAASLDGYIADPDGGVDWLFTDGDYGYKAFYNSVDVLIMGRRTYDKILEFGPYPYTGKQSFVFSRKVKQDTHDANFINQPVADFSRNLKRSIHGKIWLVGGGEIAAILLDNRLVDQIIISFHPVFLGDGIPISKPLKDVVHFNPEQQRCYKTGLFQFTCNLSDSPMNDFND